MKKKRNRNVFDFIFVFCFGKNSVCTLCEEKAPGESLILCIILVRVTEELVLRLVWIVCPDPKFDPK